LQRLQIWSFANLKWREEEEKRAARFRHCGKEGGNGNLNIKGGEGAAPLAKRAVAELPPRKEDDPGPSGLHAQIRDRAFALKKKRERACTAGNARRTATTKNYSGVTKSQRPHGKGRNSNWKAETRNAGEVFEKLLLRRNSRRRPEDMGGKRQGRGRQVPSPCSSLWGEKASITQEGGGKKELWT